VFKVGHKWDELPAMRSNGPLPNEYSPTPSILQSPTYNAPGGAGQQPCAFAPTILWSSDEQENNYHMVLKHHVRLQKAVQRKQIPNKLGTRNSAVDESIWQHLRGVNEVSGRGGGTQLA